MDGEVPSWCQAARDGFPTPLRVPLTSGCDWRPVSREVAADNLFDASSFLSHQTMIGLAIAIEE